MLPLRKTRIAEVAMVTTLFTATLCFLVAGTNSASAAGNVSTLAPAAHKALVQAAVEDVLNGRNVPAADTLFADNFARYDAGTLNVALGRDTMAFLTSHYRSAFPDLNYNSLPRCRAERVFPNLPHRWGGDVT